MRRRAVYVPSGGAKAQVPVVHLWDASLNGGSAARSDCGRLTVLADRLVDTYANVNCESCAKGRGHEGE